jgi:hypothetical protein
MTGEDRTRGALQTIFSFFLGLMVLAFVAVGVNTFYPSPQDVHSKEIRAIQDKMDAINVKQQGPSTTLSTADQAELSALQAQMNIVQSRISSEMETWGLYTSIILIVYATIVMSVSLVRSDQLRVISNGLLLGGLFSMVYGAGWVIFTGTSTARFVVILFAFGITVALGYAKFVRGRTVPAAVSTPAVMAAPEAIGDIESRLAAVEARMAATAEALGGKPTEPRS